MSGDIGLAGASGDRSSRAATIGSGARGTAIDGDASASGDDIEVVPDRRRSPADLVVYAVAVAAVLASVPVVRMAALVHRGTAMPFADYWADAHAGHAG